MDGFGRSCGTDFEFREYGFDGGKTGGVDRGIGSVSSSCRAGKSRMSIDDMESFMPDPLL